MIQIAPQMRILVAIEATDFRRGIDGLTRVCKEVEDFVTKFLLINPMGLVALRLTAFSGRNKDEAQIAPSGLLERNKIPIYARHSKELVTWDDVMSEQSALLNSYFPEDKWKIGPLTSTKWRIVMNQRVFLLVFLLFAQLSGFFCYSQQAQKVLPATQTQSQKTVPADELNIDQVIQLIRAGISEDIIIAKIKKNGKAFDLNTNQLLQLKDAKATDNIIKVLMDPQTPLQPAPAPIQTTQPISAPTPSKVGVFRKICGYKKQKGRGSLLDGGQPPNPRDLSLSFQSRGYWDWVETKRSAMNDTPPRSWTLGRRSGCFPALPYPPPRPGTF